MATAHDSASVAASPSESAPREADGVDLAVATWGGGGETDSKSDRYLARRLAAATADYKAVALTTFLLGAGVAGGAWLLLGVLVEHWLVPGGLSPALRWAWLAVAVVALVAAAIRWLLPLVRYRVNLVYAARAIEREHPELHNDLVNTVLVKAHPDANPDKVVRSLERRTAKRLAHVPSEAVIDRTPALRLAYALAALVGLAGLYELAAPKSLLVTAARLVAPWAGWAAPARVRIEQPRLAWRMPGEEAAPDLDRRGLAIDGQTATLVRGRQLVVAADIRGLRRGETPVVVVAPLAADGRIDPAAAAWRVELARGQAADGTRPFVAVLPDSGRGLDHSVELSIAAGDAVRGPIRIAVVDAPTLLVRELRYAFPPYTRREPETVAWQGDIRAVEGTEVTIVAEGNQPLEDAWIDFEADGSRDLKFTKTAADLTRVKKSFRLDLTADRTRPEHGSYRLMFQPRAAEGGMREQVITDPLEHRIEVLPDVAPEVAIEEPRASPLRVPPAAPVPIRVRAQDPDFALARVAIETRLAGGPPGGEVVLLEREHTGAYRGTAEIVPERLGAGPGATLEYRAVAIDNKPKQPNVSHSPWQALRIDPSAPPPKPAEPPPGQRQDRQRQGGEGKPGGPGAGESGGEGESGESPQGQPERNPPQQRPDKQDDASPSGKQETGQPQSGQQTSGESEEAQRSSNDGKTAGKQDGQAGGSQGGKSEQSPQAGKQAGDRQGAGQNQGQGADEGQGAGARGERQGGRDQNGRQQPGAEQGGGGRQGGGEQAGGKQAGGGKQSESGKQAGGQAAGQGKAGQERGARDSAVAADGTNDGEAIERILDHRREHGDGQSKSGQGEQAGSEPEDAASRRGQGQQPSDAAAKPSDASPRAGQGGQGEGKQGEAARENGQQPPAAEGSGEENGAGNAAGERGPGGERLRTTEAGEKGAGEKGAGEKGAGEKGAGEKGAGEKGAGEKGAGEKGAGEKGAGEKGAGEKGAGQQGGGDSPGAAGGDQAGRDAPGAGAGKEGSGGAGAPRPGEGQNAGQNDGEGAERGEQPSGQPGGAGGQAGSGGRAGGDAGRRPDALSLPEGPPPSKPTEWGEQDLAHARNAADLAVEHLQREVERGGSDVLDRLGWTRDEARAFLDRWEKMRRLAETGEPEKRGVFERALRSLGLRPDGVKSSRDVPADVRGGQAEGRRSRPPSDYQEQFKAYTQGTAGE